MLDISLYTLSSPKLAAHQQMPDAQAHQLMYARVCACALTSNMGWATGITSS